KLQHQRMKSLATCSCRRSSRAGASATAGCTTADWLSKREGIDSSRMNALFSHCRTNQVQLCGYHVTLTYAGTLKRRSSQSLLLHAIQSCLRRPVNRALSEFDHYRNRVLQSRTGSDLRRQRLCVAG